MTVRLLVTGSSGFVGTHLCRTIASRAEFELVTLDRTRSVGESRRSVLLGLPFQASRIREVLGELKCDVVVHTAAMSSFPSCQDNPSAAEEANVRYVEELVSYCKEKGAYFCSISTDLVFDGNGDVPNDGFSEEDTPAPTSKYSVTKYEGEERVRAALGQIEGVVLRSCLLYGAVAGTGGPLRWLKEAINQGNEVPLFFDEWRTPLWVEDLVQIILRCCQQRPSGVFHCAGPERVSRVEFGVRYAAMLGRKLNCKSVSRTSVPGPARPRDVSLNGIKLARELGVTPTALDVGLFRSL
ncbi:MAG: SDR family oxidoreductase [Bdellovibrionales bacterium]|nr:SDR family oxidoreductase [Bdellovibrionales bacterium]